MRRRLRGQPAKTAAIRQNMGEAELQSPRGRAEHKTRWGGGTNVHYDGGRDGSAHIEMRPQKRTHGVYAAMTPATRWERTSGAQPRCQATSVADRGHARQLSRTLEHSKVRYCTMADEMGQRTSNGKARKRTHRVNADTTPATRWERTSGVQPRCQATNVADRGHARQLSKTLELPHSAMYKLLFSFAIIPFST